MLFRSEVKGSRGSALVLQKEGQKLSDMLGGMCYRLPDEQTDSELTLTVNTTEGSVSSFVPVREIPKTDAWFENVWSEYRQRTQRKAVK